MKSKFAFMFAGFALACLFFFFFLYFFPSAFRVQAAKKSTAYHKAGYYEAYNSYPAAEYSQIYDASEEYAGSTTAVYGSPIDYLDATYRAQTPTYGVDGLADAPNVYNVAVTASGGAAARADYPCAG